LQEIKERILPRWPLQLVVSLLMVVEVFFVVMFAAEMLVGKGSADNILSIVNSVGLLLFCVLTWLAIPCGRWLAVAFLVSHVVEIGVHLSTHFGDHRTAGSLMLIGFYIAVGLVLASPLGRVRLREAT